MNNDTSLTVRETIVSLVRAYEQSAADVRQAFALLEGAEERLNAAFTLGADCKIHVRDRWGRTLGFGDVDSVVARLELDVWSSLVERLELRRFISVKRAEELDRMLDGKSEDKFPPVTLENVLAFARGFRQQLDTMLTEAVNEVFEWLRPHHSEYKRNSELEVPRRVVLSYMVEKDWQKFHVCYGGRAQARLTALQNVFSALDGKGTIAKTHYGALYDAINASGKDGVGETEYFKFRCYRNHNLHLEFRRADLLAKLNAIAGGKRLRPSTEAA